jgi:pimeloyl-ACP methyl ester carboxylesterase
LINLRKYGSEPYSVAVIHGGPGAPGGMAPVARELSVSWGVLEPLQTKASITGQIQELHFVLQQHGDLPVTLIGHSWGAWLSFMLAARYPELIKKLILIGSGPFEASDAQQIMSTRLSRLTENERLKADALMAALPDFNHGNDNAIMVEFGQLMSKTDSFDPLAKTEEAEGQFQASIYRSVWQEAEVMRESGALLKLGTKIRCPVVAIHGDHDPHPARGVEKPLSPIIKDFRLILLKDCGHEPWNERWARERFYHVLKDQLK